MTVTKINSTNLKHLVLGGCILGGGGGGSMNKGIEIGSLALSYGNINLIDIKEIDDNDLIITVSAVGAPAALDKYVEPKDYVETINFFKNTTNMNIMGIITNENGGSASVNGFIQSAVLDIPIIDAPANGRAHPTGIMGSMNLHKLDGFISNQVAIGGNPELNKKVSSFFSSNLNVASSLVRKTAVEAGGLVAVARNPINAKYIRDNAAIGGISHAIALGEEFYKGLSNSPLQAINMICKFLNGSIVTQGTVDDFKLTTSDGFDVGTIFVNNHELTFWNEYMTIDSNNTRISTFPDLIMTFDASTGYPVTSAEIEYNQEIIVIKTHFSNLKLGSPMFDKEVLSSIEPVVNKDILKYNF